MLQQLSVFTNLPHGTHRLGRQLRAMQGLCAHLQELQHLTKLTLKPVDRSCLEHLPVSLRELDVQTFSTQHLPADDRLNPVSLRHLKNLEGLTMFMSGNAHAQLLLPPQQTHLECSGDISVLGEHGLVSMQVMLFDAADWGVLQCLSTHQKLCKLEVVVGATGPAAVDASALELCTALTAWHIGVSSDPPVPFLWCQYGQKLTNLVELDLQQGVYKQDDLMRLSELTRLTYLGLDTAVDNVVAVTLVSALTGLRELDIASNSMCSAAVVPAAARLLHLESFELWGKGQSGLQRSLTPTVLNQLLPLTQLTYPCLPLSVGTCSEEAQAGFLAQMPKLTCINLCDD